MRFFFFPNYSIALDYSTALGYPATTMYDFADMIQRAMRARGWTAYRLAKECREHVSEQTIYNLLAGKPVKAATLAVVFDVLGFLVCPPSQYEYPDPLATLTPVTAKATKPASRKEARK